MTKIRSALFQTVCILMTILYVIIFSPTLIFNKYTYHTKRAWVSSALFFLKVICGITYKVEGLENIPKTPCIIASKHQSFFDIIILSYIFDRAVFILKKELMVVPVIGLYLKRAGMIDIDRRLGVSSLRKIQQSVKESNIQQIVIFPEGTRTEPGTVTEKYFSGVAMIKETLNFQTVPVGLYTGHVRPKGGCWTAGVAKIKILKPLPKDMPREEFLQELNKRIESSSLDLYKTSS